MKELGYPFRQQTVQKLETGARSVRLGEALALAQITNTTIEALTDPAGRQEAWDILRFAREVDRLCRAVMDGTDQIREQSARLSRLMTSARSRGLSDALADELSFGAAVLKRARSVLGEDASK